MTSASTLKAPPEVTDDQIIASWNTKPEIHPSIRGGQGAFWLARKNDLAVLMMLATKKNAELALGPVDPESGRDGVVMCDRDRSVALPEVAFSCPLAADDAQAWVEVASRVRGQLLARVVATARRRWITSDRRVKRRRPVSPSRRPSSMR